MLSTIGLLATAAAVLGPTLAAMRLVPGLPGFAIFALGGVTALVVAIISVVRLVRRRPIGTGGALAIATALVFVLLATRSAGVPRINDFTTDPSDPPAFGHAKGLPENASRDMDYPPAFAAEQQACCPDLRPARLPLGKAEALRRVRDVAEGMPDWIVVASDDDAGTVEAVATTRLFGFHDDIVLRVREQPDGTSRVDMRSKSRDGKGDMGTNAARIRAFVVAVEEPAR